MASVTIKDVYFRNPAHNTLSGLLGMLGCKCQGKLYMLGMPSVGLQQSLLTCTGFSIQYRQPVTDKGRQKLVGRARLLGFVRDAAHEVAEQLVERIAMVRHSVSRRRGPAKKLPSLRIMRFCYGNRSGQLPRKYGSPLTNRRQ